MLLQSRIKMSHKPKFIGFMGRFFDSMLIIPNNRDMYLLKVIEAPHTFNSII